MDLSELLTVETSVLRTLCLTVNSEISELKDQITKNLIVDDFYFPITKSIFGAISDLTKNGMNVDQNSLEQALSRRSIDVPDDFFLEDLFRGEAPSPQTLTGWIGGLNSLKSGNGDDPDNPEGEAAEPKEQYLGKTHPSVKSNEAAAKSKEAETPAAAPKPPKPHKVEAKLPEPAKTPPKQKEDSAAPPPAGNVLAPESGEWLGYLAELTKKQEEHLKTGFSGLDAEWGGIGSGLLLLAGEQRARLLDFLKQLVDQIAIRCSVPCLYLSFERSKTELRLQTLSRLSEAPATHIRDGRYDKDSAEWQSIIRTGEQAVEWLQRIYTVEATPGLAVTGIRELRQGTHGLGRGRAVHDRRR